MSPVISLLNRINAAILNPVIYLMFSVALLVFIYGIYKFIGNASDEKAREQGKQSIVWGLVGMLIMVSVFGIIKFILGTFDLSTAVYPLVNQ